MNHLVKVLALIIALIASSTHAQQLTTATAKGSLRRQVQEVAPSGAPSGSVTPSNEPSVSLGPSSSPPVSDAPSMSPPRGVTTPAPPGDCNVCDGHATPEVIEIQYVSEGRTSLFQGATQSNCTAENPAQQFPVNAALTFRGKFGEQFIVSANGSMTSDVSDGTVFAVEGWGAGKNMVKFKSITIAEITDLDDVLAPVFCEFHTSCSVPLVIGDQFGPLRLVGSSSGACTPGPEPVPVDPASPAPEPVPPAPLTTTPTATPQSVPVVSLPPTGSVSPTTTGESGAPSGSHTPSTEPSISSGPSSAAPVTATTEIGVACDVCDGHATPKALQMQYFAEGMTSIYQGAQSNCTADNPAQFPENAALTFRGKFGEKFMVNGGGSNKVSDGAVFTVEGYGKGKSMVKFKSIIVAEITDLNNELAPAVFCEFHTSCSVPLVVGDQFGPLRLVGSSSDRCTATAEEMTAN